MTSHQCVWTGGSCQSEYEQCRKTFEGVDYIVESTYLSMFDSYRDAWLPSGTAMSSLGVATNYNPNIFQDKNAQCSSITPCNSCEFLFMAATASTNNVCKIKTIPSTEEYEIRDPNDNAAVAIHGGVGHVCSTQRLGDGETTWQGKRRHVQYLTTQTACESAGQGYEWQPGIGDATHDRVIGTRRTCNAACEFVHDIDAGTGGVQEGLKGEYAACNGAVDWYIQDRSCTAAQGEAEQHLASQLPSLRNHSCRSQAGAETCCCARSLHRWGVFTGRWSPGWRQGPKLHSFDAVPG